MITATADILQLCDNKTSCTCSHRRCYEFSPYKRVPVQPHNSFLDQRSRKVMCDFIGTILYILYSVRTLSFQPVYQHTGVLTVQQGHAVHRYRKKRDSTNRRTKHDGTPKHTHTHTTHAYTHTQTHSGPRWRIFSNSGAGLPVRGVATRMGQIRMSWYLTFCHRAKKKHNPNLFPVSRSEVLGRRECHCTSA